MKIVNPVTGAVHYLSIDLIDDAVVTRTPDRRQISFSMREEVITINFTNRSQESDKSFETLVNALETKFA